MFCENCGRQMSDHSRFCPVCGHPVEVKIPTETEKKKKKSPIKKIIGIFLTIIILSCAVIGILLMAGKFLDEKGKTGAKEAGTTAEKNVEKGEKEDSMETVADTPLAKEVKALNASSDSMEKISVFASNYKPGKTDTSYIWDKRLFYALEEIDLKDPDDGKINGYSIERKQLINADTNNVMEYEIYREPGTDIVHKIVSIEYKGGILEITDYYYEDDGKLNFIFVREDVHYTPSYAIPTKEGERYYFEKDTMVKWRIVTKKDTAADTVADEDDYDMTTYVIGEASKEASSTDGVTLIYKDISDEKKKRYRENEEKMLNAGYNTYNTVLKAKGITNITGYVKDQQQAAMKDAVIHLYETEGNTEIYQCKTDAAGKYSIIIPSEARNYYIKVTQESFVSVDIYDINSSEQLIGVCQETVYLIDGGVDQEYHTNLSVSDAVSKTADGSRMIPLDGAYVKIRQGINNRTGSIYKEAYADTEGYLDLLLLPGMYTLEIEKNGYELTYQTISVYADNSTSVVSVSPAMHEGEIRIVLNWGPYPEDLDSHLFTPYTGSGVYHISYMNESDEEGNNLDVDQLDGYGPETITIHDVKDGTYKYYVVDYTNCGDEDSIEMSLSDATVTVYTSDGQVQRFNVPTDRPGVVWEVFEIRNKRIVPINRYYDSLEKTEWWMKELRGE